jgi:hypothetical protein
MKSPPAAQIRVIARTSLVAHLVTATMMVQRSCKLCKVDLSKLWEQILKF